MEKLWVIKDEVLIIEDSPHGIEAARKSGAHLIQVNDATEVNFSIFTEFLKT